MYFRCRFFATLSLAGVLGCASPLPQLRQTLHDARTNRNTNQRADICNLRLDTIVGVARQSVETSLGTPDYSETTPASASYFFTSTRRDNALSGNKEEIVVSAGGGFPIVSFTFDQTNRVAKVDCSYAR